MICHAIIGKNPLKERLMMVDIIAHFISPLLVFSMDEVMFDIRQPPGSKLVYHTQQLGVHNVSELPLTAVFLCPYPFCLMEEELAFAQRVSITYAFALKAKLNEKLLPQELSLGPGEKSELTILFDSTYCREKHSCSEEREMTVSYKEHPQTVSV